MRTLNATQQTIIDADRKVISWLFEVEAGSDAYYWSTGNKTFDGYSYAFMIEPGSFSGITLSRPGSGSGIIAPNKFSFSVLNGSGALSAADFDGADVTVRLVMSDFSTETEILSWKFRVKECVSQYKRLHFECQDFLQEYLRGDYPVSRLAKDLFPSNDTNENDAVCPPVPFGTCFVPLRSVYVSSARRYLLGPASKSYALTKVRTPRAYGSRSNWANGSIRNVSYQWTASGSGTNEYYLEAAGGGTPALGEPSALYIGGSLATGGTLGSLAAGEWGWGDNDSLGFDTVYVRLSDGADPDSKAVDYISTDTYPLIQEDKTGDDGASYTVLKPLIADSDNDGIADAVGLWRQGSNFLDMPVKFSRSDTASLTSPEQALEFFLEDIGVPSADLDTGSGSTFDDAGDTFTTWGLAFNGAFWERQDRKTALATLLNNAHATLDIADKVELRVLSATSRATVTSADVVRAARKPESAPSFAPGPFRYTTAQGTESDSGYVKWQQADEIQDQWLSNLVPFDGSSSGTSDEPGRDSLMVPFVQDSQDVQRLGTLHFQRKYRKATVGFLGMPSLIALQPDDVITINDTLYGGAAYEVVVETMTLRPNGTIQFRCFRPQFELQDWTDLSPAAISPATDDTAQGDAWEPVSGGPSSAEDMGKEYNLFSRMTDSPWIVISPTAGEGMFTSLEGALDYLSANQSSFTSAKIYAKNGAYAAPSGPVALPDLALDIEGQSQGGVVLKNKAGDHFLVLEDATKRVNLRNFSIESQNTASFSSMVRIFGASSGTNTADVMVDGVSFDLVTSGSNGDKGVEAYSGGGMLRVMNCGFLDGATAIDIGDIGRAIVSGCEFKESLLAVDAGDSDYLTIQANKFVDCIREIEVASANTVKNCIIDSNTITRAVGTGSSSIYIYNGSENIIISNNTIRVDDTTSIGIYFGFFCIHLLSTVGAQILSNSIDLNTYIRSIPAVGGGETACLATDTCTDLLVAKNRFKWDNNGNNDNYHYGVRHVITLRSTMSDNIFDGTNNNVKDCTFIWDNFSYYNKYDGNMDYRCGTHGINNGGGTNLVTASNMNN